MALLLQLLSLLVTSVLRTLPRLFSQTYTAQLYLSSKHYLSENKDDIGSVQNLKPFKVYFKIKTYLRHTVVLWWAHSNGFLSLRAPKITRMWAIDFTIQASTTSLNT
ncbi:hypothetical protein BY996DRAFT_6414009 [Phakopsora pachyrhizi]|nr:hypothetical protein BY996DRAFT_6414009 [Phakopsora pachyrhizi]